MLKTKMLAGFLVLGFAIFIAGFLSGMLTGILAAGLSPSEIGFISLFTVFSLGYMAGVLTVTLMLITRQLLKQGKQPNSKVES